MRSTYAATAVLFSALKLASAQTFTDCNPLDKTCPSDPGLGTTLTTDFTQGKSSDWTYADGTTISYDGTLGAEFVIDSKTSAPTISSAKYIMFGKVTVELRASAGTGTVSSFILESDDLDEIDWEWLGSKDTTVESNFFGKGNTTTYDRAIYHDVTDPIGTFTTYTIDWTAESVKWYIGSNLVRTLNYGDDLALNGKNYPQTPMRVKMGNWVGCADAAAMTNSATQGTCEWAGGYLDLSGAPYTMYVKSVTIQDYGSCSSYTYGDNSGSWQSITCNGAAVSSGGSSSGSASSTQSSTSTATSSGGILVETSTSAGNSTTSSGASSTSSSSSGSTTLSTASIAPSSTGSKTGSSSSSKTSGIAQSTSSDANALAPKHKYGFLDLSVMVLGLGVGYLVM
jgi:beta-glucanase (GH16 family)